MPDSLHWLLAVAGYLVGAIPFGVVVARARGVDIFQAGSGNVGATNVGRVLGKKYGFLVFFFDFLKGAGPAAAATYLAPATVWPAVTGLAAVMGHTFSPFLRFRGGKGVATAGGTLTVLMPGAAGLAILGFACTILAGQTMSLASIVAATVLAVSQLAMSPEAFAPANFLALVISGLVIARHRSNIGRIRAGTESRLASLFRFDSWMPPVHALAIGLWAGGGLFFSLGIATSLFDTFKQFAEALPAWFRLAEPVEELGSRLAGTAIGPMFPRYFFMQAICGVIATGTAIGWLISRPGRTSRWRAALLFVALVCVAVGWPINRKVSDMRATRFESTAARSAFANWHLVSLGLNLGSLALLVPGLALAGCIGQPSIGTTNSTKSSGAGEPPGGPDR
ncbi:MAG: glycerol-3-phosphate 1-O-acyltransferase PlsY [Gemmataceae bacterium]|nr:glycerol-3-phosphate 1-O-acyltransferase PlsY [Gemmataceae bacterium]